MWGAVVQIKGEASSCIIERVDSSQTQGTSQTSREDWSQSLIKLGQNLVEGLGGEETNDISQIASQKGQWPIILQNVCQHVEKAAQRGIEEALAHEFVLALLN